ncbi:hypothetical protein [Leucobacter komagatae]|nr:hypothetical protein [Leucobacter komagatae]
MSELQPEVVQRDFSAWVESRNENARSVLLLGHGTPDATVTLNGGSQSTYVRPLGGWNMEVTGLKLGVNNLNIEHRVNGVVTGSTTLTVQFGPDQLEANVSFPANVSERAIVSGTAEPGAEVSVWQGSTLVATASADRATGKYSTELPSPNRGGAQEYSLTQSVNNQEVPGAVSVRADYGSAVSIESPVNEIIHNGGELRFQGRGVPGGKVSLRENGRPGVLGAATVGSNGIWTVTVADVAKKNLKFTAEQTGRGANVTTASVEINPGVTDEALQVITPGEGQKLQPGMVTFTGTANAGATVELRSNLTGSLLGSGVANSNGAWTASVNRQLGAGNYTILVKNGAREVARSFTIEAPAPQLKLDVVNPAQGSKLQPGTVTFTGTANTGAKIELRSNVSGGLLGSGIATANGTWAVDVNRQLGAGEYTIVVKNGTLEVARSFSVVQKPVTAPLTVTSPANGATLKPGTVTFTGTATPGAAIELRSKTTGAMLGAGTATGNGSWSVQVNRQLGADTYNFQVKSGSQSVDRQFTVADTPSGTEFLQVTLPATNGTVQTGKVMFAGTANPGAVIELRSNVSGIVLGKGTTNQAGNWVAVTDRDLAKGTYTVIVRNGSLEESRTFFVDDVAVVGHLTVVTPAQGATVNPGPVTFTGLAEPHAKVVLRSNVSGLELGSGTANAAGNWSATTSVQLGVGAYTVLVESENNEIARSFQIR